MSTEVRDFSAVDDGGVPPTDVFVAHRKQILAALAPGGDAGVVAEPAPALYQDDPVQGPPDHDDSIDDDDDSAEMAAPSSAGFLQFPSGDDLDDDDADTDLDDDDDRAPQRAQPSARQRLPDRLRGVDWKSPKVLISALAALVLVATLIVVFKPSPAPPPRLTISSAPPPTAAAPSAAPIDKPIKIEFATSKCPAGSSQELNAFDGQNDTAWTCKMPYGPGQILTMNLGDVHVVSAVSIVPGFNKISSSGDEWNKYQTITKVRWLFGEYSPSKACTLDNNCLEQNTDNTRDVVTVPVLPNKKTSTVKLVILKTTPPPSESGILIDPSAATTKSFAASEIQVIGHPAG